MATIKFVHRTFKRLSRQLATSSIQSVHIQAKTNVHLLINSKKTVPEL